MASCCGFLFRELAVDDDDDGVGESVEGDIKTGDSMDPRVDETESVKKQNHVVKELQVIHEVESYRFLADLPLSHPAESRPY